MKKPQVSVAMKPDHSGVELSIGRPGEVSLTRAELTPPALEMLIAALLSCSGQLKVGRPEGPAKGTVRVPPPFVNHAWRIGYDVSGNTVLSFELVAGCWVSFQLPRDQVDALARCLRDCLAVEAPTTQSQH